MPQESANEVAENLDFLPSTEAPEQEAAEEPAPEGEPAAEQEDVNTEQEASPAEEIEANEADIVDNPNAPKWARDRKSTRLNSSHSQQSRMPSSA